MIVFWSFLERFVFLEYYWFSVTNCYELVIRQVMFFTSLDQVFSSLIKSLSTKRKCSPMNSYWLTTSKFLMNNNCLLRINVLRFQNYSWLVSSNGKNSKIKRSKHISYFLKNFTISSISRIKYFLVKRSLKNKTSPKSSVQIFHSSLRPMTDRNKS